MKMLFKQRFFSWFDSYDIYDETGATLFTVEGKLAWGHKLQILNASGDPIGMVKEQVFRFLPHFDFYEGETLLGTLTKEFTLFRPSFRLDFNGCGPAASAAKGRADAASASARSSAAKRDAMAFMETPFQIKRDRFRQLHYTLPCRERTPPKI